MSHSYSMVVLLAITGFTIKLLARLTSAYDKSGFRSPALPDELIIKWATQLREAFRSKKQPNLGISPNRWGVVKKSKKFQVSVGNSSKLGGGLRKSKKSQVSEGTKD